MSRKLKHVPLDFAWPREKTWRGFHNPYARLKADCPDCRFAGDRGPRGYSAEGFNLHQEWYGYTHFDPIEYGTPNPITIDNPRIREFATQQVNGSPEFYLTAEEKAMRQRVGTSMPMTEAIDREVKRLFEVCILDHWSHYLNQDDVDALVEAGRLMDFTRRPRTPEQVEQLKVQEAAGGSGYWLDEPNGYHPTAEEVNNWSLFGMGHDGINQSVCMDARAKREGITLTCARCDGRGYFWEDVKPSNIFTRTDGRLIPISTEQVVEDGAYVAKIFRMKRFEGDTEVIEIPLEGSAEREVVSPKVLARLYDEWEDYEPPTGPGFQLWETVSEGSPVSPVFKTLDELCAWAEGHSVGGMYSSKERWKKMLDDGFVYHEMGTMADGSTAILL